MKEITLELVTRQTIITKVKDKEADEMVAYYKSDEFKRKYAQELEVNMNLDDAGVSTAKVFLRDIPGKGSKK